MDTQEIVWLVVAVVVLLALVGLAVRLMNKKKHERAEAERAQKAAELRQEADQHAQALPDAELRAKEEELRAEKLRREAAQAEERAKEAQVGYQQQAAQHEDRLREADRLDPDGSVSTGTSTDAAPRTDDGESTGGSHRG